MAKYKNAEMHRHIRLPGLVDESASLAGIAQPAVWNNKQEFGYYVSSYYIPEKVNWIKIKCWAGGGGSGGRDNSTGHSAASGAYIEAVFKLDQLNLFPGDKLTLIAGGGGQRGTSDSSAADSGGAGGVGSASYGYAGGIGGAGGPVGESGGGGGGGAAAAMLLPNGNILVLAGGGAGGNGEQGGNSGSTPAYGGGVYVAQNGVSTNGAAGQRPSGDGGGTGGGGGGGPGGGTGSAVNEPSQTNPSSGGRSDYTLLQSYNVYSVAGNSGNSTETTVAAPNNSDIDYFSGVGTGGKGSSQRISNESGGDGLMLLYVGA